MANVAVMNMNGEQVGNIDLNDAIFGIEANEHVMHLAVVQYLANQRQGTQSTKTRAEVRGGGRNLGDRKAQVEQDTAPSVPLSGLAVA